MAEFLIAYAGELGAQRYWDGDVIQTYEDGTCKEPPALGRVILKVPGIPVSAVVNQATAEWWIRLSWQVVSSVLATDTHTIKVSATDYNPVSGMGKVSQPMVETYLSNWGALNITFGDNQVQFIAKILDVIQTAAFWAVQSVTGFTFTEVNYNQTTGVHRCRVGYGSTSVSRDQVVSQISARGGGVVNENLTNKTITFEIDRTAVRTVFQDDVARQVERMIVRRKYGVVKSLLDAVVANGGWLKTLTESQYNSAWFNKLTQ